MSVMRRVDLGEVEYEVAAKEMRGWVEERVEGTVPDRMFLLSHPPVITYGPRTVLDDLGPEIAGIPTVAVAERGVPTPSDAEVRDAVAKAWRCLTEGLSVACGNEP